MDIDYINDQIKHFNIFTNCFHFLFWENGKSIHVYHSNLSKKFPPIQIWHTEALADPDQTDFP